MPLNLSSLTAQQQAAAIYIGYYDRAPDPDGSTFWEGVVTAGNLSLAEIAADFSTQAETRAEHPFFVDPTASAANAFISELYMNLFNRAPDVDGLEFWSGVLQDSIDGTGALSVGQIILEIIQGAQDTADGNDLTTIQNKIAVATAWTDEAETAGLTGADDYANDAEAQASAKSILEGVTDDSATVTAAAAEAVSFFTEGQTFTLTADATSVEEGGSATFSLVGAEPSQLYAYQISENLDIDLDTVFTDENGNATITVPVSDEMITDQSITVSIIGEDDVVASVTTVAVDDAPELTGPAATLADGTEDTAATVSAADLLEGFTDEEGATLSVTDLSADNGATVADNGDGTYTITPADDFNGAVSLSYNVSDGANSVAATQSVDFAAVNDAPTTTDATAAATEAGAAVTGQLEASDVDAGDTLTYALDAAVEGLTLNADGSYSFDPSQNTAAQALTYTDDALDVVANYTVSDGNGGEATGSLTITVEPTPLTFSLVPSADFVEEGATVEYQLVASEAVQESFTGSIQVTAGDGSAGQTENADFGSGSLNPVNVTIAEGETESTVFTLTPTNDSETESPESYTVVGTINGETVTVEGEVRDPSSVGGLGQTFSLTTGVDTIPGLVGSAGSTGTDGDDTIVGLIAGTGVTVNALDEVDGGGGTDSLTLNVTKVYADELDDPTFTSVETFNVRSSNDLGTAAAAAEFDVSGISDLTTLNVTQADNLGAIAAATTDVNVSGIEATGTVDVVGGKDIDVNVSSAGAIKIGEDSALGTTNAAGSVTVTSDDQTGTIDIDGGTDVSVTASVDSDEDVAVTSGNIAIGADTAASGTSTVVQNLTSNGGDADGDDLTGGTISVTGGTSIDVTVNATSIAQAEDADGDIDIDDITVTSDGNTTDVSVVQNATATTFTKAAVDAVAETSVVTFKAMTSGETLEIATAADGTGLIFTAGKDLTAEEVAEAFAGLTAEDTQDAGGPVSNGIYTDALPTGWTSGAADGASVTFTAADDDESDLVFDGTADAPTQVKTAGTAEVAEVESSNEVTYGDVTVEEDGTEAASITSLTVDGFDSAQIGVTNSLDALSEVTLKNSKTNSHIDINTTQTTFTVNVDNIVKDARLDLDDDALITDLTINATGSASEFHLDANVLENLTINADVNLDIDGGNVGDTADNLESITITGAGAVVVGDVPVESNNLTTFDASANTGGVTATISAADADLNDSFTSYEFSEGDDVVTLDATAVDVGINLNGGDDKITLATGTSALGGTIAAGLGTDTLAMAAADAETVSGTTTFETQIDGFEKLELGDVTAGQADTVDLANMDDIDYVVSGASTIGKDVTVTGSTDNAADTVSLVVNGTTYTTAAAVYADGTAIAAALAAAINGNAGLSAASAADVLTITSTTTRVDVGEISATSGGGAADTVSATTAYDGDEGLVLNNLAADATVELTENAQVTTNLADASGGADAINVLVNNVDGNGNTLAELVVDDVETVAISVQDGDNTGPDTHELTLAADSVTSVTVGTADGTAVDDDGNQDETGLTLDITEATAVTTVDASAMVGSFTYTADDGATIVTGGSGADSLTASGSGDELIGGAGDDTLTGENLTEMTGGDGADTFVMNTPSNLNSYSTIMDLESGDIIDFSNVTADGLSFVASAVTLGGTAVFQDFANEAVNQLAADNDDFAWFQFDGDTYIVGNDDQNDATDDDFENGVDSIIQIVGTVDLSTASYNQTDGTLEIA